MGNGLTNHCLLKRGPPRATCSREQCPPMSWKTCKEIWHQLCCMWDGWSYCLGYLFWTGIINKSYVLVFELSHKKLIFKTYFMWKKIMFKNTRIWQIISIYFFSWLCYHLLTSVRYPHLLTDLHFFPYDIFT